VSFTLEIPVRFGACDPAGILYFPRYFDLFHQTMEEWFGAQLGFTYHSFLRGRQLGLPAVHTEADFRRPCGYGETVRVTLSLARVGATSVVLDYVVTGDDDDDVRATGRTVCVVMDLDPASASYRQAVLVPDDLRTRLEALT
jgi:4-hydroxybenzoyl-CoA thioesterase